MIADLVIYSNFYSIILDYYDLSRNYSRSNPMIDISNFKDSPNFHLNIEIIIDHSIRYILNSNIKTLG